MFDNGRKIKNYFLVQHRNSASIEYTIRHDLAGVFIGRNGQYAKEFVRRFNCYLFVGQRRENQLVLVVPANGRAKFDQVDAELRRRLASEVERQRNAQMRNA